MFKWLFSTLAFLLLVLFLSALNANSFLTSAVNSVSDLRESFKDNSQILVDESLDQFYAQLSPEDKANFEQIEDLTPAQKNIVLTPQCQGIDDSPFCDPRFISGSLTLDEVLREDTEQGVVEQQNVAVDQIRNKFASYMRFPLILIAIISGVLSLLLYLGSKGLSGAQSFFGNAAWLSALSTVSFKLIPKMLGKLISALQPNLPAGEAVEVVKQITIDWISKAMAPAFTLSLIITIIAFIVWISIKVFRKQED